MRTILPAKEECLIIGALASLYNVGLLSSLVERMNDGWLEVLTLQIHRRLISLAVMFDGWSGAAVTSTESRLVVDAPRAVGGDVGYSLASFVPSPDVAEGFRDVFEGLQS